MSDKERLDEIIEKWNNDTWQEKEDIFDLMKNNFEFLLELAKKAIT
jgi:hypothetical protein